MKQYPTNQFYFDLQSLRAFTDYLRATGWTRIKYQNRRLAVYSKELEEGESSAIVALPEKATYSDFHERMVEAIQRLAEVEETTPDVIYQKIQSIGQDSLRFSLKLPADMPLPSLEMTARFLQGARNLVVYAACMEQEVRPYFTQPFQIGREQAERCRFDHTSRGSFGFTIKSPLPEIGQLYLPGFGSPLERRIVERITRGLLSVQLARETQRPEEISEHYITGLNGNMCKAVLEMLEDLPDTPVEYSVRWSFSLQPAHDVQQFTPIILDREVSYYLRDASKYLETRQPDLEHDKTIEGIITGLNVENQSEHQVTVQADGYGKVSFLLDTDDYVVACDAHRDHNTVTVTGTLQRNTRGGSWTLLEPRSFQVKS